MATAATLLSFLVVVGLPAVATVWWVRSRYPGVDSVELLAAGYGGFGVSCVALWTGAQFFGPSRWVLIGAPLAAAAVLIGAARIGGAPARTSSLSKAPAGHLRWLTLTAVVFEVLVFLPFLTYGLERADGIHRMAMTDWYKHLVVTTALGTADAFPPTNPFLHGSEPAPYYYGFHWVAASIGRVVGQPDGAYPILLLLTLATAAATPFVAYVVARTIIGGARAEDLSQSGEPAAGQVAGSQSPEGGARAALLAAIGATLLAGFDLVPLAIDTVRNVIAAWPLADGLSGLREAIPSTHLDYWIHHNERQVNAPYLTTIWAPQHMTGVLLALLAIHFVLRGGAEPGSDDARDREPINRPAGPKTTGRQRVAPWLLPAILLGALPAISAYVAMGLGVGVLGSIALVSVGHRCPPWKTAGWRAWLVPGIAAASIALPILLVLGSGAGPGIALHVSAAGSWVNGAILSSLFGARWWTNLLDSFAVYLVELGLIGVLAVVEIRWRVRASDADDGGSDGRSSEVGLPWSQRHVGMVVVTMLLLVTFVRPPVGGPNNLYARPMVLVWFLLAPFAGMAAARLGGGGGAGGGLARNRTLALAACLCLMANGYALVGVLLEGSLFWATDRDTLAAIRWVNDNTEPDALVAVHPDDFASVFGYWLRRPLVIADERHALLFGAGEGDFADVGDGLRRAYDSDLPDQAAGRFEEIGAETILFRFELGARGLNPRWASGRCLENPFSNGGWLVVRRVGDC